MPPAVDPRMASTRVVLPGRQVLKAFDRRRVALSAKASADKHAERPFWGPHPNPVIAAIEQDFFRFGSDYLRALYAGTLGAPVPRARSLQKAFQVPPNGNIDGWGALVELFKKDQPAHQQLAGWDALVHRLSSALLPGASVEAAASRLALQTHLMWRLGERVARPELWTPWQQAARSFTPDQYASAAWARAHGMAYVQGLAGESVQALREVFVQSKEAGEGVSGLQRRLFDRVSEMNRDWRRIAVTETAIAATNGQLASLPGADHLVEWMASPMACPHCLKYLGQRFKVLKAPDASKGDTAVWVGKNNVGRSPYAWSRKMGRYRDSHELYWPCQPLHPLCACSFIVVR